MNQGKKLFQLDMGEKLVDRGGTSGRAVLLIELESSSTILGAASGAGGS